MPKLTAHTTRDNQLEARDLGDGWTEIRLVVRAPPREVITQRGGVPLPREKICGRAARFEIARLFVAGAAGIADMLEMPELTRQLAELWERFESLERFRD